MAMKCAGYLSSIKGAQHCFHGRVYKGKVKQ